MPIGNRVGYHNNLVKGISRQGRDISRDKYIETSRDFYSRLVVSMMSFFSPSWWGGGLLLYTRSSCLVCRAYLPV